MNPEPLGGKRGRLFGEAIWFDVMTYKIDGTGPQPDHRVSGSDQHSIEVIHNGKPLSQSESLEYLRKRAQRANLPGSDEVETVQSHEPNDHQKES